MTRKEMNKLDEYPSESEIREAVEYWKEHGLPRNIVPLVELAERYLAQEFVKPLGVEKIKKIIVDSTKNHTLNELAQAINQAMRENK